jgi:hypothetical protein
MVRQAHHDKWHRLRVTREVVVTLPADRSEAKVGACLPDRQACRRVAW